MARRRSRPERREGQSRRRGRSGSHSDSNEDSSSPSERRISLRRLNEYVPGPALSPLPPDAVLNLGYNIVARGRSLSPPEGRGHLDYSMIKYTDEQFVYVRPSGYPSYYPVDQYLLDGIQQFFGLQLSRGFTSASADQKAALERSVLQDRDGMFGFVSFSIPSFDIFSPRPSVLPPLAAYEQVAASMRNWTVSRRFRPAQWLRREGKLLQNTASEGSFLGPSDRGQTRDPFDNNCYLREILRKRKPSWYGGLSIRAGHVAGYGVTEWLEKVLVRHRARLEQVNIYHAVRAALYRYPKYTGFIQAIVERFNTRWNTIMTTEGETTIDLWSFHQLSGLPIVGYPYEEVALSDARKDMSNGEGRYLLPFCYRYLLKVWRDLANTSPPSSIGTRKVPCTFWVGYFYKGPYYYDRCFPQSDDQEHPHQLIDPRSLPRLHPVVEEGGHYPSELSDVIDLAAYLAYWLATFAIPINDDAKLRSQVIYPACCLACGVQLSIAPAALANVYHGLGTLASHTLPRSARVVTPTHYISAWAGLLFPELVSCNSSHHEIWPLMLRFASEEDGDYISQLQDARNWLGGWVVGRIRRLRFDHSTDGYRPSGDDTMVAPRERAVDRVHTISGVSYQASSLSTPLRRWLKSIRPSVLVLRQGRYAYLQPYYPFRVARNFGYDQHVPLNSAEFALSRRVYDFGDAAHQAMIWWNYFQRIDMERTFTVPASHQMGHVDLDYTLWWRSHGYHFTADATLIEKCESQYLLWSGRSMFNIPDKVLDKTFPAHKRRVKNEYAAWKRLKAAHPEEADRHLNAPMPDS